MDDDQQFCLRWNNHQSTLISVFDTLLENGTLVDCTLAAEGKFLKAHKVVLSACSPYFAALLSQQYDKHPIFILKDVKFQELRAMMDYMYRGEVNISQDQLAALLKAAESLQIKGLSDNSRSSSAGTGNAMNKPDNLVKPPPPVPVKVPSSAVAAAGLTIENKRPRLAGIAAVAAAAAADLVDTDASVASREGSTSPSRKRKKISMKRKSIESNNVLDNHEQLSNSSSHSTTHATNNITTSTTNVLPVTKKTDHESSKQQADVERGGDSANESANTDGKGDGVLSTGNNKDGGTHSELMIEPKNEYPDDDDDGNENVEDLTIEDDDMMDDIDQAGPSHGGEGSSSGYGNWNMDRSEDGVFMPGQDGHQGRDAQDLWSEFMSYGFGAMADENGSLKAGRKNGQNFQCAKCGKWYSTKNIMLRHMNHECGVEKNIQCKFCSKMFLRKWNLKQHIKRIHENMILSNTPLALVSAKHRSIDVSSGGEHSPLKARAITPGLNPM